MINKKYFKKIAVAATAAALLFQVQPAIASDVTDDGENVTAEAQEAEVSDEAEVPEAEAAGNAETEEAASQEAVPVEVQPIEIAPIEIDPVNIDIPEMEESSEDTVVSEETETEQEELTEEEKTAAEENIETLESETSETETPELEAPEATEADEVQAEATEYKTDFQFENDEVKITATATEEAKLPQNTEMKAVRLEEGTAAYEEAKAASAQKLGTDENAQYCFYDVTFVADGQELSPEKGTVTIKMEFKNIQVDAQAQTQNIVHIEDTEDGRQVQDVTSAVQPGDNLSSVDFAM